MVTRVCLLALAAALAFSAPQVRAQDLTEAMATAYNSNPSLLAQRSRLRQTDEGVSQALSGWRPRLTNTTSTAITRSRSETTSSTSQGTINPTATTLTLTQPVYRGGRTVAATRQAEFSVFAERARTVQTEQSTLFDVATAYLNVLRDQSILQLRINNEQRLERQLEATQDRFRVGEVTRTDVAQASARLSQAKADRVRAEGNLQTSREQYRDAVGVYPGSLRIPEKNPLPLPQTSDELQAQMLANNPNIIAAQFDVQAAEQAVKVIQGELLPEASLQGQLNYQDEPSTTTRESRSASLIGSVSIPLYEAGAVYSRVRAARHAVNQRRAQLDDVTREALQAGASAFEDVAANRARMDSLRAAIEANQIALEGVEQEAAVGSRTVLDVLDAEQTLLDSQVNLVTAVRDELVATFRVYAAIGQLTALQLGLPVEIYDVEGPYQQTRGKWWGSGIESEYPTNK
ncbi:MAG: TolC family outer membrane protein [Thalassobaculales bacterium]